MSTLGGIRPMLALTIRRERLHAPAWYGLVALLVILIAVGIVTTYPTEVGRIALAQSINASAEELFLIGPVPSTDVGGLALWRTQGVAATVLSLASIFTVVRNTRATEESGTSELLGTAAVGRAAPLAAVLGVAAAGSLLAGLIVGVGFVAVGAAIGGCALVGAQVVSFGLLAAALAALTGQVVRTARAATGIAVALVITFYLLRGVGDVLGGAAYWVSPFGWIAAVHPFSDGNPVMLMPAVLLAMLLGLAAVLIASRRDLGAGILPDRAGRAQAGVALEGPTSLALRLSRAAVIGWAVGALVVGLLIAAVSSTVNQQIALKLGGATGGGVGLVQVALYLSPLFAAILGVQTTLRLRGEVTSGRAEVLLAGPVNRSRWLLAHTVAGAFAALALLVAFGLGLGLAQASHGPGPIGAFLVATVSRTPAAWAFVGLTTLLLATVPRAASPVALAALGVFIALEFAVEFHLAPPETLYASPFALVPQLPDGPRHAWRTILLIVIALGATAVAARTVRRQDIH